MATSTTITLRHRYDVLKQEHPKLRIRDAAKKLFVSELELLELQLGDNVLRLKGDWKKFLAEIKDLGYVMALTRNEYAVHERKGVYDNISFNPDGKMGVAVNPDIDLRFLMWTWKYAYAVRMEKSKGPLFSFQFFDQYGEAVHKIFLTQQSDPTAYQKLVEKYKAKNQITTHKIQEKPLIKKKDLVEEKIDISGFQQDWLTLKDTHDFFPLLKKYQLDRAQALRLAPKGYAFQVDNDSIVKMLRFAAERYVPIMVFVNSNGCIQIHTGEIKNVVSMHHWINVMDPEFNLHLNLDGIAQTWVVKKPTADGVVTAIEVFDAHDNLIVYCFGKRKPGLPELEAWREIVRDLNQNE
ncbi:MAG: hemin-degrading factor [Saprospiraceae bacterium]|nr:MAG: hemin-degrading factor [Saprospiraceae bacterium]